MKKSVYLKLQLKRCFKLFPSVFVVTILVIACIALAGVGILNSHKNSEASITVRTGVVGDVGDSYLGIGVEAVKSMDSSRFYIDLVNMTEPEAKKALQNREITGYVHIPPDFIKTVTSGDELPLKYVTLSDPAAINKIVEQEVITTISQLVNESQKSIYAAVDLGKAYNQKDVYKKINKLNLSYIEFILNRNQIHELTLVGVKDDLSYGGYYLCAIIMFFLSVWGVSCNKILTDSNRSFFQIVNLRGIGSFWQIFAKTIGFLLVTYAMLGIFAIVFGVVATLSNIGIPEISGADIISSLVFILKLFPAILMFVLMHIMLCEVLTGIGGIIAQFLIAIVLGYVSGIFYPNTFFPQTLQTVAAQLPLGAAFAFSRKLLSGLPLGYDFKFVAFYCVLFFTLAGLLRKHKIVGDAKL